MKIIISGTTGVGKSTTVEFLKKKLEENGKTVVIAGELVVDSPYFDLYFKNLSEWAFLAQLDFLMQRFKQYFEIINDTNEDENTVIIFDRHFLEDLIFAELKWVRENTSSLLTNAYRALFQELLDKFSKIDKPDYIFNLKASFDVVLGRMKKRGREIEATFSDLYWQDLYYRYYGKKSYRTNFKTYSKNFIEVDTDDLNPQEAADKIYNDITREEK